MSRVEWGALASAGPGLLLQASACITRNALVISGGLHSRSRTYPYGRRLPLLLVLLVWSGCGLAQTGVSAVSRGLTVTESGSGSSKKIHLSLPDGQFPDSCYNDPNYMCGAVFEAKNLHDDSSVRVACSSTTYGICSSGGLTTISDHWGRSGYIHYRPSYVGDPSKHGQAREPISDGITVDFMSVGRGILQGEYNLQICGSAVVNELNGRRVSTGPLLCSDVRYYDESLPACKFSVSSLDFQLAARNDHPDLRRMRIGTMDVVCLAGREFKGGVRVRGRAPGVIDLSGPSANPRCVLDRGGAEFISVDKRRHEQRFSYPLTCTFRDVQLAGTYTGSAVLYFDPD